MAATQKKVYPKKTDEEIYEATTNKIVALMEKTAVAEGLGWEGRCVDLPRPHQREIGSSIRQPPEQPLSFVHYGREGE